MELGERLRGLAQRRAADRTATDEPPPVERGRWLAPGPPLLDRPVVRLGVYAWAVVGLVVMLVVVGRVLASLTLVVIPLVLALFPAAILVPPTRWAIARGLHPAVAASLVLIAALALLSAVVAFIGQAVAGQVDELAEATQEGAAQLDRFLAGGAFGLAPIDLDEVIREARDRVAGAGQQLARGVLGAALVVVEGVAGLLFGVLALFFYLKDGPSIARWLRDLFPARMRGDVHAMADRAWGTLGAYIRGQTLIAVIDAVLIGVGIFVLGVPLALPLTVLVFFGGLFPVVGAVVSGMVAVLVALATQGLVTALILLAVIVVVQQLEGDLIAPLVLGRVTRLHPLAAIAALTAGAVLLGILGAFLAIPITASLVRAAAYLRGRPA